MGKVNPLITVMPIQQRLTAENGLEIIKGHDVVVDAQEYEVIEL